MPRRYTTSFGSSFERALRAMRRLDKSFRAGMTRGDVARLMQDEFECSRATAYRMAAAAIDTLLLEIDEDVGTCAEHALHHRRAQQGMLGGLV